MEVTYETLKRAIQGGDLLSLSLQMHEMGDSPFVKMNLHAWVSPLWIAVHKKAKLDVVEFLLDQGHDPNHVGSGVGAYLSNIVEYMYTKTYGGKTPILDALIEAGLRITRPEEPKDYFRAYMCDYKLMPQEDIILIEKIFVGSVKEVYGDNNFLLFSPLLGSIPGSWLKFLHERGSVLEKEGEESLYFRCGNLSAIEYLGSRGLDICVENKAGYTPVGHFIKKFGENTHIVKTAKKIESSQRSKNCTPA